jgi:hypothetical protein
MDESLLRPEDLFPLRHLARAADGFAVPTGPFDPLGAWTATYELVERAFKTASLGALQLERVPDGPERALLRCHYRKHAGGGVGRASAEIRCAVDALASPLSWTLESWVADPQGREIEDTRLNEKVDVHGGELRRTGAGRERVTPAPGPLALDWGLFDAVQRLPRKTTPELRFTLIDRLGACLKPDQLLASTQSVTVSLGGQHRWGEQAEQLEAGTRYRPVERVEDATAVRLHSYEHTGQGILPTTYWVDDAGRLLFVLTGMLAWIRNPKVQV